MLRGSGRQARHGLGSRTEGAVWPTDFCSSDGGFPSAGASSARSRSSTIPWASTGACSRTAASTRSTSRCSAPTPSLSGFAQLKGNAAQIAAVQEDEEFIRVITDASLIVEDLSVIRGYANEGVAAQMGIYAEAIAKVPQSA